MQENNSAKFIVRVDPEIADIIPGYLINRENDIAAIYDALEKKDLATVRILGHNMKGSGGGYGFDAITDIGMLIEEAAKDGNDESIRLQVKRLEDYLLQIEIVYE